MANVGEEEGVIEQDENKIIQNVIRLDEIKAYEVMTPRVVAAIAPEKMTLREYYDSDAYDHFSRIPVYADSQEFITGYVLRDDALEDLAEITSIPNWAISNVRCRTSTKRHRFPTSSTPCSSRRVR